MEVITEALAEDIMAVGIMVEALAAEVMVVEMVEVEVEVRLDESLRVFDSD